MLLETNVNGSTVAQYTLSNGAYGNLISQRRGGARGFYHFDALGSTDRLTAAAAAVTDSYTYYAFGEQRASSGTSTNPYRYVGRLGYYRNGTDLLYLRARYYRPDLGRFLSPGSAYVYEGNNAVTRVSASGRRRKPNALIPPWLKQAAREGMKEIRQRCTGINPGQKDMEAMCEDCCLSLTLHLRDVCGYWYYFLFTPPIPSATLFKLQCDCVNYCMDVKSGTQTIRWYVEHGCKAGKDNLKQNMILAILQGILMGGI